VRTLEPWTWHVGGVHSIARDPQTGILSAGRTPVATGRPLLSNLGCICTW
jgi:hypothetical protein